jgi:hypothetical protein
MRSSRSPVPTSSNPSTLPRARRSFSMLWRRGLTQAPRSQEAGGTLRESGARGISRFASSRRRVLRPSRDDPTMHAHDRVSALTQGRFPTSAAPVARHDDRGHWRWGTSAVRHEQ